MTTSALTTITSNGAGGAVAAPAIAPNVPAGSDASQVALSLWPGLTPAQRQSVDSDLQSAGYTPIGQVSYASSQPPAYNAPANSASIAQPSAAASLPEEGATFPAAPAQPQISFVGTIEKYWWLVGAFGVGIAFLIWRSGKK